MDYYRVAHWVIDYKTSYNAVDYITDDSVVDYSFKDSMMMTCNDMDYVLFYEDIDEYDSIPLVLMN